MIENTDLAWMAGIIDGEGSIMFFDKRKLNIKKTKQYGWITTAISVTNCDEFMIKRISQIWHELGLNFHYTLQKNNTRNKKWNEALKIQTTGLNNCKKLLEKIEPFLWNKKYLAKFLLEYINWRQIKGFDPFRKPISKEEIENWFNLYHIVKQPKIISPETTRKASKILGSG